MGIVLALLAIVVLAVTSGSAVNVATIDKQDATAAIEQATRRAAPAEHAIAESMGERTAPTELAMQSIMPATEPPAAMTTSYADNPCVNPDGTMVQDCAYLPRRQPAGYRPPDIRLASDWVYFGAR